MYISVFDYQPMKPVALLLALLFVFSTSAAHCEGEEKITKAIEGAEILSSDYKFNVARDGAQIIVSTYINTASKNIERDCKVDAVLLAKATTEADASVLKVRARFYDLTRTKYAEVVVSKNDVLAFASGQVSKQDLMATLEITEHSVENAAPVKVSTDKASADKASPDKKSEPAPRVVAAASSTPAPSILKPVNLAPTDKYSIFKKDGLAFYYPKSWALREDVDPKWGDIARLETSGTKWANVLINLKNNVESPEQAANDQNKWYWSKHRHLVTNRTIQLLGYQGNLQACVVFIRNLESSEPYRIEKHVFFGYKNRIYTLSLQVYEGDAKKIGSEFDVMLRTLCYSN